MSTRSDSLVFRATDSYEYVPKAIQQLVSRNKRSRTVSDELRAAAAVYIDLLELARLREVAATGGASPPAIAAQERRLKDDIGRVMLAAISSDQETVFENAVGVEYPAMGFAPIDTPFEKLVDWIVGDRTINAEEPCPSDDKSLRLRDAILAMLIGDQPLHASAIRTILVEANKMGPDQKDYLALQVLLSQMFMDGEIARTDRETYVRVADLDSVEGASRE
jgi:hypothetical protein